MQHPHSQRQENQEYKDNKGNIHSRSCEERGEKERKEEGKAAKQAGLQVPPITSIPTSRKCHCQGQHTRPGSKEEKTAMTLKEVFKKEEKIEKRLRIAIIYLHTPLPYALRCYGVHFTNQLFLQLCIRKALR